jgi:hypothetical protein
MRLRNTKPEGIENNLSFRFGSNPPRKARA